MAHSACLVGSVSGRSKILAAKVGTIDLALLPCWPAWPSLPALVVAFVLKELIFVNKEASRNLLLLDIYGCNQFCQQKVS